MDRIEQRAAGWVPWDQWLAAYEGDVYSTQRVDNGGGIDVWAWTPPPARDRHEVAYADENLRGWRV